MRITEDAMTGQTTRYTAHRVGDAWMLTCLPGFLLRRDQALLGMRIAEKIAKVHVDYPRSLLLLQVNQLARELRLPGSYVMASMAQPSQVN